MLSDTSLYEKQMSINVFGLKNDIKKLGNDINKATENSNKFNSKETKSGQSAGASFSIYGTSAVVGAYGMKENGEGTTITYTQSNITANNELNITTGKDTNIIGSKASGEKVTANIGGNLNIESLQETEKQNYKTNGKSASGSIGLSDGFNFNANTNKMDSDYKSVTEQAGIYAGDKGFDINVTGNTDLKGAVIDSTATADKNTLNTGTITFSDVENKAEYDTKGYGISYSELANREKKQSGRPVMQGDKGLIPAIPMESGDETDSSTKSAVADGTITIRNKKQQKQDIENLRRETKDTLNKLNKIFDKDKIEEKQELAGQFSELSFNAIHNLSKNWTEEQKALAHSAVGYIAGELANNKNSFSTALTAGINKFVTEEILKDEKKKEYYAKHPEQLQWLSAALGSAIGQMAGDDATSGASIAASGTKNNRLNMTEQEYFSKQDEFIENYVAKYGDTDENRELAKAIFTNKVWKESEANEKRLYGEKLITQEGYEDVRNTVGKSNVTKDGYVISGYDPKYGKVISFNNTFIQTGDGHQLTSMGIMSYPTGYYVLTDDKLVMDAKDKFGKGITGAIFGAKYVAVTVGMIALDGLSYFATNDVKDLESGMAGAGLWQLSKRVSSKIINGIVAGAVEIGKYYFDNNKGIVEYPYEKNKGGEKQ